MKILISITIILIYVYYIIRKNRMRSSVSQLLLTIMTCAVSLVIAEITLYVIASSRPANDYSKVTWGHEVHNNSLGFREREFEFPKPHGTFRIMVLGDSLTWGAGLPSQKRYSNLLEEHLSGIFRDKSIEVLNFGIVAGPTVRERDIVYKHIGKTDPDLIIMGFCVNDPQPRQQNYAIELEQYDWLFALFHNMGNLGFPKNAGFLRDRFDQFLRNVGLVPQWPEALDRTYAKDSPDWREFEMALRDIKSISDSLNLPPPIFVPLLHGNGDFNDPNALLEKILKWCRQAAHAANDRGFTVLNMEEEFKSQGYRNRWVNQWDSHPSAECNEVYARKLAGVVAEIIRRN